MSSLNNCTYAYNPPPQSKPLFWQMAHGDIQRLVVISDFPTFPMFAGTAYYINSVKRLFSLQRQELITRQRVLLQGLFHTAVSGVKVSLTRLRDIHNSLEKQLPFLSLTGHPRVPTCFAPVARWTGQAVFSLHSPWNISKSIGRTRYR